MAVITSDSDLYHVLIRLIGSHCKLHAIRLPLVPFNSIYVKPGRSGFINTCEYRKLQATLAELGNSAKCQLVIPGVQKVTRSDIWHVAMHGERD